MSKTGVDGHRPYRGTGNNLANRITSNSGANTLDGGVGADTLDGGEGGDSLVGGDGVDSLYGGAGADFMDGRDDGSADLMDGGTGNDRYIVDNTSDAAGISDSGGDADVISSVSFNLNDVTGVENLVLTSSVGTDLAAPAMAWPT